MVVDRLEELLAQMADESGEEQEDVLALKAAGTPPAAPAPKIEDGTGNPEGLEDWEGPQQTENQAPAVLIENGEPWAKISQDGGEYAPEDGTPEDAAMPAAEAVRRWEQAEALEGIGAETVWTAGNTWPETSGMRRGAEQSGKTAQTVDGEPQGGLEKLYHRTAQASRPPAQSLPAEQAGRTLHAEEPGRTAALTVEELDRAVRRDSRRYDGGMTIF